MWSTVNSSQRQDSLLRQLTAVERGRHRWAVVGKETSSTGSSWQQMGATTRHRDALLSRQSRQIKVILFTNCQQVIISFEFFIIQKLIRHFCHSINSYCEDDRYQKQDRDCWTGDHLGDYTHKVMDMHSQKYNPEVPTLQVNTNDRLHHINDQLISLKNMVNKQVRKWFVCAFDDNQVSFLSASLNEANQFQSCANQSWRIFIRPYLDDPSVKIRQW